MADVCSWYSARSDWLLERRDFAVVAHGHLELLFMALLKKDQKITGKCYGFNESAPAEKKKMSGNKRSESELLYSTLKRSLICNMRLRPICGP